MPPEEAANTMTEKSFGGVGSLVTVVASGLAMVVARLSQWHTEDGVIGVLMGAECTTSAEKHKGRYVTLSGW